MWARHHPSAQAAIETRRIHDEQRKGTPVFSMSEACVEGGRSHPNACSRERGTGSSVGGLTDVRRSERRHGAAVDHILGPRDRRRTW
jgi:hypothetical protein